MPLFLFLLDQFIELKKYSKEDFRIMSENIRKRLVIQQMREESEVYRIKKSDQIIITRYLDKDILFKQRQWRIGNFCWVCQRWKKVIFQQPSNLRRSFLLDVISEAIEHYLKNHYFRKNHEKTKKLLS